MGKVVFRASVPRKVKEWADRNGFTVSELVRIGLANGVDESTITLLSSLPRDFKTSITLNKEEADKLESMKDELGVSRNELLTGLLMSVILKLDGVEDHIGEVVRAVSNVEFPWSRINDEVVRVLSNREGFLNWLAGKGEVSVDEAVKYIVNNYDVLPTSAEISLIRLAKDNDVMIMNNRIRPTRVVQ